VELVPRLVPAGLLKDDPASIQRITALAPRRPAHGSEGAAAKPAKPRRRRR
jgi:hypothetical protein